MSKVKTSSTNKAAIDHVKKRTSIGGLRAKTSSMNKSYRKSFKEYRGQGK